jgi:hypothetical protein
MENGKNFPRHFELILLKISVHPCAMTQCQGSSIDYSTQISNTRHFLNDKIIL